MSNNLNELLKQAFGEGDGAQDELSKLLAELSSETSDGDDEGKDEEEKKADEKKEGEEGADKKKDDEKKADDDDETSIEEIVGVEKEEKKEDEKKADDGEKKSEEEFDVKKWASELSDEDKQLLASALETLKDVVGEEQYKALPDEEKVAGAQDLIYKAAFVAENIESVREEIKDRLAAEGKKEASGEKVDEVAVEYLLKIAMDEDAEAEQATTTGYWMGLGFRAALEEAESKK